MTDLTNTNETAVTFDFDQEDYELPEGLLELDKESTDQLTIECQSFHWQIKTGILEIGKRLIVLKRRFNHGEWQNYLQERHNIKCRQARRYMACAARYGDLNNSKRSTSTVLALNSSQMIEMLSLPAEETENFIEQKAAEGTPVEDMTVKALREEIKEYKERLNSRAGMIADKNKELAEKEKKLADTGEELAFEKHEKERWQNTANKNKNELNKLEYEIAKLIDGDSLDDRLAKIAEKLGDPDASHPPEIKEVEVYPADYKQVKQQLKDLQAENQRLEKIRDSLNDLVDGARKNMDKVIAEKNALEQELREEREKPIEVAVQKPDDYDAVKSELAELKAKQRNERTNYTVGKRLTEMFGTIGILNNCVNLCEIVEEVVEADPAAFQNNLIRLKNLYTELNNYFEIWEEKELKAVRNSNPS